MVRILREMFILAVAAFMVIYLINPGAGFLEFLPDNLPVVGNLDEVTATVILLRVLAYYGINLPWLAGPLREAEARRRETRNH